MKSTYDVMQKLREIRKKRGLRVEHVVQELHEYDIDVAVKTVYGWEGGQANPSLQAFIALCSIYGVKDILQLFDDESDKSDEGVQMHVLWDAYRKHPEMQLAVKKLLDLKSGRR